MEHRNDRIEKRIELRATVSRVWRALTDYREFGAWFGVSLEEPFAPGRTVHGRVTQPGCGQSRWEAVVQEMEAERLFSFTWHPYAADPALDYSAEAPTLVEFRLEETATGTLLLLTESGFNALPPHRGPEAFRRNNGGWSAQLKNIQDYVTH